MAHGNPGAVITRIDPWFIPGAVAGVVLIINEATVLHGARNKVSSATIAAVLLAIATFVAWMRSKVLPIARRKAL